MVGVCLGGRGDERVLRSRDPTAALLLPAEFKKFLLYARQMEIRGVDIDNPYYNYIISFTVPDIDNVTVVDYDALEQRIYWSDVRTQTIKRAFINGTGVETVVSAGGCGAPRTADPQPSRAFSSLRSALPLHLSIIPAPSSQLPSPLPCRPAQCSRPLRGLGFQKPLLDQLRRQQEADQRGPAGRLLQERRDPGAGQAPLPGGAPAAGVSPAGRGANGEEVWAGTGVCM